VDLTLNFLFKRSHTDVNILKEIKAATEGRSNVLHNATVVAHAYMNAGKRHYCRLFLCSYFLLSYYFSMALTYFISLFFCGDESTFIITLSI
jgi:hypothetical protein